MPSLMSRNNNDAATSSSSSSFSNSNQQTAAKRWMSSAANSWSQMMQPRYALPDKTVASQVLMYRQLLHTKCRHGLRLSRPYQGTVAQKSVMHMPWWEQGIEDSGKMVISYDNLIVRVWMNGAIMPFVDSSDLGGGGDVETFMTDDGLPPIPHSYWVSRLGFQQPDPVTDFRSGGILSLAMMVHMVESVSHVVAHFGPSSTHAVRVLPFGITCINVTDMLAKCLMLSKGIDKMDALLSQKPFWKMFADPNALLVSQELSMMILVQVVDELDQIRTWEMQQERDEWEFRQQEVNNNKDDNDKKSDVAKLKDDNDDEAKDDNDDEAKDDKEEFEPTIRPISVFDFPQILQTTEERVVRDMLGSGPKTVDEMRQIHAQLQEQYQKSLIHKRADFEIQQEKRRGTNTTTTKQPLQPLKKAAAAAVANVWRGGRNKTTNDLNNGGEEEEAIEGGGATQKIKEQMNVAKEKAMATLNAATSIFAASAKLRDEAVHRESNNLISFSPVNSPKEEQKEAKESEQTKKNDVEDAMMNDFTEAFDLLDMPPPGNVDLSTLEKEADIILGNFSIGDDEDDDDDGILQDSNI